MNKQIYQDKEIYWFYAIVAGLPFLVCLLSLTQNELWVAGILLGMILVFLFCGWPFSAEVNETGDIIFTGPIRRTKVTAESLIGVKAAGVHDYRAHIILRNRGGLPIGYRCTKYADAPGLAKAVWRLIKKSPYAKVTDDAKWLLDQTAKLDDAKA